MFREKLETFAGTIDDEKERFIFRNRLLPNEGETPLTLQEVGDRYRLTRERARQIEAKLTGRLRAYLHAEIPDFECWDRPSSFPLLPWQPRGFGSPAQALYSPPAQPGELIRRAREADHQSKPEEHHRGPPPPS